MKLNVENSEQLIQLVLDDSLFKELVQQLEKDFVLANIPLKINENITADSLVALIREKVYYLMMEHFSKYLNLMYVMDVAEKDFKHIVVSDTVDVSGQLTFIILKRAYKKVWYRNRYQ